MTRAVRHVEVSYKTPAYCDSVSTRLGGHDDGLCWHTDEGSRDTYGTLLWTLAWDSLDCDD